MLNNKRFLAIIPARAGSKRLKNKNILNFAGHPLISWTINSSINSKYIDKTIVSTDSAVIKKIALDYGAEVPFKRPKYLSNDLATRDEVIQHAINFFNEKKQDKFDYIIYLQPTSPLRNESHIDDAIEYMLEKNANAIVSVCKLDHPVEWTGILPNSKDMSDFINSKNFQTRSQDFPIRHRLNGAIYICSTINFSELNSVFLRENIYAYIMPQNVSIDIDEKNDLVVAESILKSQN
tara:strand:- start:534 stop:1241 length:708 start_codon:yes stop_codon:yes gene_type:complete